MTSNNHRISINCPEGLYITSYPSAYFQIFSNLISNSLEHAFEYQTKGDIQIDVNLDKGVLKVVYHDDGIGIPKELVERIFDPFFSSKKSMARSGLGLSIVWNIITNTLHGSIICESYPEKGTSFLIQIPYKQLIT